MTQALSPYVGLRGASSVPDLETLNELVRLEDMLRTKGKAPAALRSLRGLVAADINLRRAWELGARAFANTRYDYEPPAAVRRQLAEGERQLRANNRMEALRIAQKLVLNDPNLKQAWDLGLSSFANV